MTATPLSVSDPTQLDDVENQSAVNSAVDRSVLAAISKGNDNIEREFIALFRRVNDEDVAMLHKAVRAEDVAGALQASHRMSGACRMIGATTLATVCERLEAASRANDFNGVKANMPDLQREVERVYVFLDSM